MAKAKRRAPARAVSVRRAPARSSGGGGPVVVVRETVGRAAKAVGRRRASGAAGAGLQKRMQAMAMGGLGVGFIEKHFGAQLPQLPFVGRKGAIALAVYFFKPKSGMLQDVGVAAACLAGYQFAKEQRIDGVGDDFDDED
jgi:hypothetical protein